MSIVKFLKKRSLKDDFETGRKGKKKAGRRFRKTVFRALRKALRKKLDAQDGPWFI